MASPAEEFDRIEEEILVTLRENNIVTLSELIQHFVAEGRNPDLVREVVWGLLDNRLVQLTSDRKLLLDPSEQHATVY